MLIYTNVQNNLFSNNLEKSFKIKKLVNKLLLKEQNQKYIKMNLKLNVNIVLKAGKCKTIRFGRSYRLGSVETKNHELKKYIFACIVL